MGIDFSKLQKGAERAFSDEGPKNPAHRKPVEPRKGAEECNYTTGQKEGKNGPLRGSQKAQRGEIQKTALKCPNFDIYYEYQENIRKSGQLQTEILKGAKAGEDIYTLFLKAVRAIGAMTDNPAFPKQIEEDLKTIYGKALQDPAPLRLELRETEIRLEKIREAHRQEGETASSQRLAQAVRAHEERIAELKRQIQKAENKPA